ncbi:hypothetical protein KSS87_015504 [Heliosperma pusillum]|nr:hypothetical protein KSS87_015504 [Heliosperma pusillum]
MSTALSLLTQMNWCRICTTISALMVSWS